jgi:hypothetical protein
VGDVSVVELLLASQGEQSGVLRESAPDMCDTDKRLLDAPTNVKLQLAGNLVKKKHRRSGCFGGTRDEHTCAACHCCLSLSLPCSLRSAMQQRDPTRSVKLQLTTSQQTCNFHGSRPGKKFLSRMIPPTRGRPPASRLFHIIHPRHARHILSKKSLRLLRLHPAIEQQCGSPADRSRLISCIPEISWCQAGE